MNRDTFRGGVRHLRGRVHTAAGSLAGDPGRQAGGIVDQVAGGAQYAYGRARKRAEDLAEDGRDLYDEARRRGDAYAREGRRLGRAYAGEARDRAGRVLRHADANWGTTVLALAGLAFVLGWLARPKR